MQRITREDTNTAMSNTVQALFERQVENNPQAPAVYRADGECWSYSRLNRFANRIAHRLLQRGIVPEQRVGVCMQRSPETVGVLLGILKARAAYVPLDLNLPAERLSYIVEDAMISEIFADVPGEARLRGASVKDVEILPAVNEECFPEHSPELPASIHDLANVLYTSGSTGRPKGAMLEHAGVLRLVIDTEWLTFLSSDVFLQISSLSFDLCTFELWGPLLNGGSVVTAPQSPSLGEIERMLEQFKVTTLWLTAGLFNVVMEERPEAIRNVKYLLTGGDICSPRHARIALEHLQHGELMNCYGPTENATFSTCHRVTRADTEQPSVPIGVAVDKSPCFLLDQSMKPIRDLQVGEVFVGGEGLSRGYWNRPELNSEKFLQVEVEPGKIERLYRTGDLGRYNQQGLLEFVGRTDFQVKIRGFRVEPEEIELALSLMPGLLSSAVIPRGSSPESKQLYCCYVQERAGTITTDDIKSFLKAKFPDYMVPTFYRELSSLPRNTNDKVDRKALDSLFASGRPAVSPDKRESSGEDAVSLGTGHVQLSKRNELADGGTMSRIQHALRSASSGFFAAFRKPQQSPVNPNG